MNTNTREGGEVKSSIRYDFGNNGSDKSHTRLRKRTPRFDDKAIRRQYGDPYSKGSRGGLSINERYFVARFAKEHMVIFDLIEREFYFYNSSNGAWQHRTPEEVREMFSMDWQDIVYWTGEDQLLAKRTSRLLESLTSQLRGFVGVKDIFKRNGRVIHLRNGMLHLDDNLTLRPFSPEYYSRNVCPIAWNPDAECPRFKSFMRSGLDLDDVDLMQRWGGSLLLGGNAAQRVFILTGTPGAGKSTLMELFERIVGISNVYELRTALLHERFEQSRFIGKSMLTGKDVPGDFLQKEGAYVIKKLVGHDNLSAEKKGSNADIPLFGNYGIGITCNSRLRVKLDGDAKAWKRRLVIIHYEKLKPKNRISRFADLLMDQEAEGILCWMVKGAIRHLEECDDMGDYELTDEQRNRPIDFLAESDSLRHFIRGRIQKSVIGEDLQTEEITTAYSKYCSEKDWIPFSTKTVERTLPGLMLKHHQSTISTHVKRKSQRVRGYLNVQLAKDL